MVENVHGLMTNVEERSFYILVPFFPQNVVKQHKIHLIDIFNSMQVFYLLVYKNTDRFHSTEHDVGEWRDQTRALHQLTVQ